MNDKAEDEPRCIELSGNVRGVQHAEQLVQSAMEDIERQRGTYLLSAVSIEDWRIHYVTISLYFLSGLCLGHLQLYNSI